MIKEIIGSEYCGIRIVFEAVINQGKAQIIQRIILNNNIIERSIKNLDLSTLGNKCNKSNLDDISEDIANRLKVDKDLKEKFIDNLTNILIKQIQCNTDYLKEEDLTLIKSKYEYDKQFLMLHLIHTTPDFTDDFKLSLRIFGYGILPKGCENPDEWDYEEADRFILVEVCKDNYYEENGSTFIYNIGSIRNDGDFGMMMKTEAASNDLLNDIIHKYIDNIEDESCITFGMDKEDIKKIKKNDDLIINIPELISGKMISLNANDDEHKKIVFFKSDSKEK